VRAQQRGLQPIAVVRGHPERVEVHYDLVLVQDAHHDRLAAHHGQGCHAEVDVPPVNREADAAVLREPPLGDVEGGHDLHAGDQAGHVLARHCRRVVDDAVDAVAHAHVVGARLEVDVGRAAANRVGDHGVDELDDRRLVGLVTQLDDLRLVLLVADLLDGVAEVGELPDQRVDVLRGGDGAADLIAGRHRDVVEREHVGRVGSRDEHGLLAEERDRDGLVAACFGRVEQVRGAVVDLEGVEVDVVEPVPLGERLGELVGVDDLRVDQRLAERNSVRPTLLDDLLHELALGESELHDYIADSALGTGPLRRRPETGHGKRAGWGGRTVTHALCIGSGSPQIKRAQAGAEAL
jgi:hypothetical protein